MKRAISAIFVFLFLCLVAHTPSQAQFAYRTNTKPDTYSIIDWKLSPKGRVLPGLIITDLKLPAGCLLIGNDICIPAVDVDPTMPIRLPIVSLSLNEGRGYYLGFIRGIGSNNQPDIPLFMVSIIDTDRTNPSSANVIFTAEVNYFNDVVRTANGHRIYVAPRFAPGVLSSHLAVYNFPCVPLPCLPSNLSLDNVGPNQISLQPLSLALSEDEVTLWIGGVDSSTHTGGGIVIVDTGINSSQGNRTGRPRVVGFISCPNLGPVCK
jgi:hypothetical protein